jgi:comEA protein
MQHKLLKFLLIIFLIFSIFVIVYNFRTPISDIRFEEQKININLATTEELEVIPLVGKVKSKNIIEYRKSKGIIKSFDELDNVKGVGFKTIESLKKYTEVN